MSQYNITPSGGGGAGINLTGDTGGILGPSAAFTIEADTAANNSGASVSISGAGTTLTLNVSDSFNDTKIGLNAGSLVQVGGGYQTALGQGSLGSVVNGLNNVAVGYNALNALTVADYNTALGTNSLSALGTGSHNIAVGNNSALAYTTNESGNIVIGGSGVAGDADQTWIGFIGGTASTQTACFIDGIAGVTTTVNDAVPVLISASTGQLGTISSSERYKKNIQDMADASDPIYALRPTTFSYKADKTGSNQYGLIAEEVAKVMPDLVVYDAEGLPQTVKYQDLPILLLNEIQKLKAELLSLKEK